MNFYERTKFLCESKKGITLTEMVKILNMSTSMPTKWKNGLIPNGETLIKISDFLEESIDYLLCREEKAQSSEVEFTFAAHNELAHDLSPEQIEQLKTYAEFLRTQK